MSEVRNYEFHITMFVMWLATVAFMLFVIGQAGSPILATFGVIYATVVCVSLSVM